MPHKNKKQYLLLFIFILIGVFAPRLAVSQEVFQLTDPTKELPKEYTISDIQVEGNESTRTQFIINASSLNIGTTITIPGTDISSAIKRLFRAGLFSDVKVSVTEKTQSEVKLLITVTEQPRILEYKLEGVKRSQRKDLRDLIVLLPGIAITDANVSQAVSTIKRFYKEKGYWFTEVDTEVEAAEALENRATLIFNINPGKRLEIQDISFVGNGFISNRSLEKRIKSLKQDKWWRIFGKKVFKEEDFEEGTEKILTFYRNNGFSDARIVKDSVFVYDFKREKQGVGVQLNIEEGPQYKVRNISFEGNTVYSEEQLKFSLGFSKGEVFNQEKFESNVSFNKTSSDLNSLYQNIGYLFVQIIPSIEKIGEDSLDISFDIYEDEIATINEVDFYGNTKTHDDVVRRTLRTIPGSTYSRQAIVRSVRELGTLGYFDPASIEPDVIPNPVTKQVDVTYGLDESQSTDNFEFSGGYGGPRIGAIISARVNFNNFSMRRAFEKGGWDPIPSGDGQTVSVGVQVTGSGFQSYSLGFSEPWLNGKPTSLGVNLSYNFISGNSFQRESKLFAGSVSLGKRLKFPDDFFSTRTTFGYQLYDVSGLTNFIPEGTSTSITIQQDLERNTLDNFISPNYGSKFSLSGQIGFPIPGLAEFYKIKTSYQHHVPLVDKLVLTSQAEFGYVGYFTTTQRSGFERFLLGGTQLQQRQSFLYDNIDMRGIPGGINESIAPSIDGQQVGGRIYNKYVLELRYPAVTSDQIQVIPYTFVDAGNNYLDFSTFDPFNVKRSTGFGVRLFLPILGLIDLSYGYRLDGIEGTLVEPNQWQFLFNIGAPF